MKNVIHCTELPSDVTGFYILTRDQANIDVADKVVVDGLYEALELAERLIDTTDEAIILDDILKFGCRPLITERNATLKPFIQYAMISGNMIYLKSDELSESLETLINKIFD